MGSKSRRDFLKAGLGVPAFSIDQATPLAGTFSAVRTPEDFRATGTTDTAALQDLANWLGPGRTARIEKTYTIDRQIEIADREGFRIEGNGRIRLADGIGPGYGSSIFYLSKCRRFSIAGLVCDGNRSAREPAEAPGHLIVIDACHEWTFENVAAVNGTTDGFYIYVSRGNGSGPGGRVRIEDVPSRWTMKNCRAVGNFRQGLSIIESLDWSIDGGSFSRTSGLLDVAGSTGPCAGIDLEPDREADYPDARLARGLISNVLFEGNQGPGLLISSPEVTDIVVRDCQFRDNRRAAIMCFGARIKLVSPRVSGWNGLPYTVRRDLPPKRGAIDLGTDSGPELQVVMPHFDNVDPALPTGNPLVYVHGRANAPVSVIGLSAETPASPVAQIHAQDAVFEHGNLRLTHAASCVLVTMTGTNSVFRNNYIQGPIDGALLATGDGVSINGNRVLVFCESGSRPVFDCRPARNAEITSNVVERTSPGKGVDFAYSSDALTSKNRSEEINGTEFIVAPSL
jgi:hypothetical protein